MTSTFYIGGSPCSGKSTTAERLSREYGLRYFKVDDFLDKYMELGARDGRPLCRKLASMDPEQIWMRDARLQCEEEFGIYGEIFDYILADLDRISAPNGILTEGAAWVPRLFRRLGLPGGRYIAITPTPEFQISHYRQRPYVPFVLEGCSDKERAFQNWMDRDILFAREVREQCRGWGYLSILNDGTAGAEEVARRAAAHFGLTSGNPR